MMRDDLETGSPSPPPGNRGQHDVPGLCMLEPAWQNESWTEGAGAKRASVATYTLLPGFVSNYWTIHIYYFGVSSSETVSYDSPPLVSVVRKVKKITQEEQRILSDGKVD
jgi:hypothetical protein